MTIYLGADHRGFALKEHVKKMLHDEHRTVIDLGNAHYDANDDYPDFAKAVAEEVAKDPEGDRGIVICGSGAGVDIAANKIKGIRAVLAMSPHHVEAARHDDDVNVLALAADFVKEPDAMAIVDEFLKTEFDREEKYVRRVKKIEA
ncbi:MAG TPA: RpiB/LacA/LacB family sugar-phosphate isomerase [Candidatus Paceibacterota bacterium]|nr:RpiB/LacA/LacB family sugar-phosphate isomerase [Candidatus Paceibacterota bacterium]